MSVSAFFGSGSSLSDGPAYLSEVPSSMLKTHPPLQDNSHVPTQSNSHNYQSHLPSVSQPRNTSSISRSRSPSFTRCDISGDVDVEDADLSHLVTKRMQEAKQVRAKLSEQVIPVLVVVLCAYILIFGLVLLFRLV